MNELRKHLNEVRLMSISIPNKSIASANRSIALHSGSETLSRRQICDSHNFSSSLSSVSEIGGICRVSVHREADVTSSIAYDPDHDSFSSSPSRVSDIRGVIQVTVHRESDTTSILHAGPAPQDSFLSKDRSPSNKISSTIELGTDGGLELPQSDPFIGKEVINSIP